LLYPVIYQEIKSTTFKNTKIDFYAKPDSILLKSLNGYIYITKDTTFEHYEWLNPKLDNNNEIYLSLYKTFSLKKSLNKRQNELPKKWTEIFLFDKKFYVYSPSDWMSSENLYLSDTILYHIRSVDPDIEFISNYKKINNGNYQFTLFTPNYSDTISYVNTMLIIELLDPNLKVYKWSWSNAKGEIYQKRLFVDSRNVKSFPMIVEDCGNQKCFFPNGGIQLDTIK
jgi:hypothetical protein